MENLAGRLTNSIAQILGISCYDGLLSKRIDTVESKKQDEVLSEKTPVIHSASIGDEYTGVVGVYYTNYANIYNTLNRNIGGSEYMSQNYNILDEGSNIGQRESILFDQAERPMPLFMADTERDSYADYMNYVSDKFGIISYYDTNTIEESQYGYNTGVKRSFYIGDNSNPNYLNSDTLLGKLGSASLSNILFGRNNIRREKDFVSITNISYYDKGRNDIETDNGILPLDNAVGFSYSKNLPNFGIRNDYSFVGFAVPTEDYSYTTITQRYNLFDNYGDLTNNVISLTNSPAYNSIRKPTVTNPNTVEMANFLIDNLSYKGTMYSNDSFVTYFGLHGFTAALEDINTRNRYAFYIASLADAGNNKHSDFHYDEGALQGSGYEDANKGVNHGIYMTSASLHGSYGKDLTSVTDKAFRENRYDTIISRFATQNKGRGNGGKSVRVDGYEQFQTAVSDMFGMSHGRNLLKVNKDGDKVTGVDTKGGNGYDNPYCRVWTYHHQYNRICDTIRPFSKQNYDDATCTINDINKSNEIAKYRNSYVEVEKTDGAYWFGASNRDFKVINSEGQDLLSNNSVRNKVNGLVNITPTNINVDGEDAVKVKNCMFSIENLAWKDVHQIKSQLSGEQTGPLGGRIMWFPPYGLTFSENVTPNWNTVSFIGRGENIYTYSNTERSGQLSFLLLIDHPSVLNEWNKDDTVGSDGVDDIASTEQKILRFFAGCETLSPFSGVDELNENDNKSNTNQQEMEKEPEKEPAKGQFSFVVYFPNNYSGHYDDAESVVSYLLNGVMFGEDTENKYKLNYDILLNEYSIEPYQVTDKTYTDEQIYNIIDHAFLTHYTFMREMYKFDDVPLYSSTPTTLDLLLKHEALCSIDKYADMYGLPDNFQVGDILKYYNLLENPMKIGESDFLTKNNLIDIEKSKELEIQYGKENIDLVEELSCFDDASFDNEVILMEIPEQLGYYCLVPMEVFEKLVELLNKPKDKNGNFKYEQIGKEYKNYANWADKSAIKKNEPIEKESNPTIIGNSGSTFVGGYEMKRTSNYGVSTPLYANGNDYDETGEEGIIKKTNNFQYNYVYSQNISMSNGSSTTTLEFFAPHNGTVYKGSKKPVDFRHSWGYRIDADNPHTFKQSLYVNEAKSNKYNNYIDSCSYGLNGGGYANEEAKRYFSKLWELGPVYSFADVFAALTPEYKDSIALKDNINEDNIKDIQQFINYGISKLRVRGSASVQGNYKGAYNNSNETDTENTSNDTLSRYRGSTILSWLKKALKKQDVAIDNEDIKFGIAKRGESKQFGSVDDLEMKIERFVAVTIWYDESITLNASDGLTEYITSGLTSGATSGTTPINQREGDSNAGDDALNGMIDDVDVTNEGKYQNIRYDDESLFFKNLSVNDPFLHSKIKDKIKYFDPAFHSITPEGFAARLTFLHQCTRQGNTIGASDNTRLTATNLSFGRPPICVLRIGDFYNTKIVIESLSINYENGSGIQWDLNPEGIGVMPMYAKIDISFKFIGGSDLEGPINRLQNALSFNYYANTRVYDNRSDSIKYNQDKSGEIETIKPWTPEME